MTVLINTPVISPSVIRWTAICYLPCNDDFVSVSHVVGTFFRSEAEAKNAALNYFIHHPCISYMVYQQAIEYAVNEAQTAKECRTTAAALSADIGLHVEVEANHV